MNNVKTTNNETVQYSSQYISIRKEAAEWPAWKVTAYNTSVASSAYAKKIEEKKAK